MAATFKDLPLWTFNYVEGDNSLFITLNSDCTCSDNIRVGYQVNRNAPKELVITEEVVQDYESWKEFMISLVTNGVVIDSVTKESSDEQKFYVDFVKSIASYITYIATYARVTRSITQWWSSLFGCSQEYYIEIKDSSVNTYITSKLALSYNSKTIKQLAQTIRNNIREPQDFCT